MSKGKSAEDMASLDVLLDEIRGLHQENKEQSTIREEIIRANARITEAEERIEKAEERIHNTEEVLMELLMLQVKLEDRIYKGD